MTDSVATIRCLIEQIRRDRRVPKRGRVDYQLTPKGATTVRCGYRITPVEDLPRDFEGVRVKTDEWYGIFTYRQWARIAKLADKEFVAELLAIQLTDALGIPVIPAHRSATEEH